MSLIVVEPPAELPVTVQEAAQVCALTSDDLTPDRRAMLTRSIAAVTSWLAGPDGWLGRSLVTQTLELRLGWPPHPTREAIALPRPPFVELVSISTTADGDTFTTADLDDFRVETWNDGLPYLSTKLGRYWPAVLFGDDAIRVRYRAGYGADPDDLDPGLRHAILAAVARDFHGHVGGSAPALSDSTDLFSAWRVWGFVR